MKKIKVFFAAMALFVTALASAQNITVTGTVSDAATGEAVPFASVQLKGTPTGVAADAYGAYSIAVPSDAVLVISSIGYLTVEEPVAGKAVHNVALSSDSQALEETIVVAFGTSTKESFTGSAKVVGADELAKSQVSAVTSALAGQVAGVQLSNASGAPGSTPSIRIRGYSSINAGKEPLYVVDGVPYDGDINNINPSDVESMTVLKDAASNALYGARGANGVIMITTKKSKGSEAVVTFDAKVGVNQRAIRHYDYITDPGEYYEAHYLSLYNKYVAEGNSSLHANALANEDLGKGKDAGGLVYLSYSVPEGQNLIGVNGKLNPNATLGNKVTYKGQEYTIMPDNWEDEAYRLGLRQEYNVSVSGSDTRSSYYASVGYLNHTGITANSDMQRLTARFKGDYQAKKWLKVTGNFAYANFNYNSLDEEGSENSTGNIWAFTSQIAPIYPLWVRDGQGKIMVDQNGIKMMDYGDGMNAGLSRPLFTNSNAVQANRLDTNNAEGNAFAAQGIADFTITKELKFTVNASATLDETRGTSVSNPYYGQFASAKGTLGKSHSRTMFVNTQQLLSYKKEIGLHTIDVMAGHEYYDYTYAYLYGAKQNMFLQSNKELAGAVVDNKNAYSYTSEYNVEGYFARAQYEYDDKIFGSASFRRDASSNFAADHRWGNFWSLGAAWVLSKEDWFDADFVETLKVKASIGSQGNDSIGSYLYTDTYDIVPSDDEVSLLFSQKGKEDITWETITNANIGTEFTLFNGRIDGSLEYFNRTTTDMLFAFNVAPSLGYTSYYDNVGDLRNSGFELGLNINILKKNDLKWDFNFNATTLKNKILYLHDDVKTINVEGYDGYVSGSYFFGEGLPMYTRYMRKYAGPDAETGASTWWKTVKDADGVESQVKTTNYADATEYLAPSSIPDLYGGFGTSISFKGFDFSINCSYQIGGKAFDSGYQNYMTYPYEGQTGANIHKDIYKAWTKENTSSDIPAYVFGDNYAAGTSTRFLTSASYLNIENINLGYTLPSKLTSRIGIQSLRFYAACENVWYWSARQGFDPRYSFTGATNYTLYSPVRTISGGVTFKF